MALSTTTSASLSPRAKRDLGTPTSSGAGASTRILTDVVVLAILLMLGAVACGAPVGSASDPSPSPSTRFTPLGTFGEIAPAPATHLDSFAGAELDIPSGWLHVNDAFAQHYAPSEDAMWVFRRFEKSWRTPELFTVMITSHQNQSAEVLARGQGDDTRTTTLVVAGRPAERIRGTPGCDRCWDDIVYVQWDEENVIGLQLRTHRSEELAARTDIFESMFGSLREAPRDPYAARVRAFLQARVRGHGAERYLSAAALDDYERRGLYESRNCGRVRDYGVRAVVDDPDLGTLYVVTGGDMDVLRMDPSARADPDRLPIISEVQEYQACGTS